MSSSYIGAEPVDTYSSLAVQHFTTSVTTSYSLSQSVTSENDIRLTINNVVQQPGSSYAYTCSGSTLTLSSATASSDTMYCVFIGKSIGTINPPDGSVSDAKITAMATSKLTGTISDAQISSMAASKLTGNLPAISGAALTNLPAGVSVHVGRFTRDSAAATASVAYTGVGFQPKAIMFISHIDATDQISWGFDDGTTANNKYDNSGITDDTWASAGSKSIMPRESSANYQTGGISAFNADGFSISWVKGGSSSGLQYIDYLAIG